jgi:7-cyano-7-deazaguanine synthase
MANATRQRWSARARARRLRREFPHWRNRLGADHVLSLDVLAQIGGSALTDNVAIAMRADGLPTTFVPGRNLMFLTGRAALGTASGIYDLVGGMCETDYSGYPDCRTRYFEAMQQR